MLNLINNSIKFTQEGGVTLQIFNAGTGIGFKVSDTGIGIPAESQSRIFEAFEQINNTYVGSVEGAGLGLSIVKEMTNLMQGEIALDSRVDEGSTFTITLPLTAVAVKERVV
jgi:signal transduction histidine kinase